MPMEKPSQTALKVALNILSLGSTPGMDTVLPSGIVDTTATLLVTSGAVSPTVVRLARSRSMAYVSRAFDWMMPGQFVAFGQRKAFCERQVREAIQAGVTQVLVLGAGYDTMGWRLSAELTTVNFFEIDHPATARVKAKGIHAMGYRENLHLLAEDLSQRELVDVLTATTSWDQTATTLFIAEGLLMYLPHEAVCDLFRQCTAMSGDESRFAFSYIGTAPDGKPDAGPWKGVILWLLKMKSEPWLWSIQPAHLDAFLKNVGWKNAPELIGSREKYGVEFFGVATT
ncbi:SAM-dependent methyltransferase [candidate division KSB3 bacterium]|uniref:S-adenosyl-L-methionine-dependent methyltransferase n=1 Tax=candidate division KSB3 bacterium TaxID=2044937 RepID=A0A9D5Q8M7_9BACT|nr:SAM-dependent methyltransferase [candidate division KSB3 bacterium]MBD3327522.1 SAM-dependent methyltransferase [candidate division KSB3 bacterium]